MIQGSLTDNKLNYLIYTISPCQNHNSLKRTQYVPTGANVYVFIMAMALNDGASADQTAQTQIRLFPGTV